MSISNNVHFVGIGGSGMSGLARLLHGRGCVVSGSDQRSTAVTTALGTLGIRVHIGHAAENIPPTTELIIRSAAIRDDNPEIAGAQIPVIKYAEALGEVSREKETIAISGTHGKTTTTAMITCILQTAGMEPSFVLGSEIQTLQVNGRFGKGANFVCEACEYDRSFLNLSPKYAVITNVEEDHLDYYKDINDILSAFSQFAGKVPPEGHLFGCIDCPNVEKLVAERRDLFETTSLNKDADWRARNVGMKDGAWRFEVLRYGKSFDEFALGVNGIHNVSNALLAIACTARLGVGKEIIQVALEGFRGTKRRMEVVGTVNGFVVIDDYAHHPTEIQATLKALKESYPGRKIWCVFQPHQHSRTRFLMKDFARSFNDADVVLMPEIYAARDTQEERQRVSSRDLVKLVNDSGKPALYLQAFDEVIDFLKRKTEKNTVIVTMGAGNVDDIARRLVGK